ncbi:MAG: hypothetical protein ACOYEA_06930 [Fermentimonas sp.]
MKRSILISLSLLFILLAGCSQDAIIDNSNSVVDGGVAESNVLTFSATMPGTRLALAEKGLNVVPTWKNGDKLDLCVLYGEGKAEKISSKLFDISDDGKSAKFSLTLPEDVTAFDLYGVHGGGGLDSQNPKMAILPASDKVSGTLNDIATNNGLMVMFEKKNVDLTNNPDLSVQFKQIGSIFSVDLNNYGAAALANITKVEIYSEETESDLGVFAHSDRGLYDITTGNIKDGVAATSITFDVAPANVESGKSLKLWSWYIVNPKVNWPKLKLRMTNSLGEKITTDVKLAKGAVANGKVYHFSAFWNGSDLMFEMPKFPETHAFYRLAEYNVGTIAGTFTDSHANDKSGYFTWDDAQTACPEGYHTPSLGEINTFIPNNANHVAWGNRTFKIIEKDGNKTAYNYVRAGKFIEGSLDSRVKITGRYLGKADISLEAISDMSWWSVNKENDIVKYLSYNGRYTSTGKFENQGMMGLYWSSYPDPSRTDVGHDLHIGETAGYTATQYKAYKGSVRCVRD